jgi:large subunit ribosomal protein L15
MDGMKIHAPKGATKNKRIKGRGTGSGKGGTAGRGHNGQNSRSGGGVRPGFEGGQMPLYRRIARRGFSNYPFKIVYTPVNLSVLSNKYSEGEVVSLITLREKGIIKKSESRIKILGKGELDKKLSFEIEKFSSGALKKITDSGSTIIEKAKDGE